MLTADYPILEFDPTREALIEPHRVMRPIDAPEHCVICFFQEVVAAVVQAHQARVLKTIKWECGAYPIYEIAMGEQRLAFFHSGVGAPLAVGLLEEVIPLGCRKFMACGGAGVLDHTIAVGHALVPTLAVRDEGTSYHYLPPAREVAASAEGVAALERILQNHGVPYRLGKTWTTDAPYRETRDLVKRRQAEGCLTVEMEAAAFFAVAQFRGVTFAQLLYGGDDVSGSGDWDHRSWMARTSVREQLFWLAAEACLSL
jgi:uridine phosphorylase